MEAAETEEVIMRVAPSAAHLEVVGRERLTASGVWIAATTNVERHPAVRVKNGENCGLHELRNSLCAVAAHAEPDNAVAVPLNRPLGLSATHPGLTDEDVSEVQISDMRFVSPTRMPLNFRCAMRDVLIRV